MYRFACYLTLAISITVMFGCSYCCGPYDDDFNSFGGIMPQERLTWKFFRNGSDSPKIETVDEFRAIIDRWLADPKSYAKAKKAFLDLRYVEDPTRVIEELVELANEVAGLKLQRQKFPPEEPATTHPFFEI